MRSFAGPVVIVLTALVASCQQGDEELGTAPLRVDVAAVEELRIGDVEGNAEYLFGNVVDVATDSLGRIYVADRSIPAVRVYDWNGEFLTDIGRAGQGPGELGGLLSVAVGPDGRLYVLDARRITAFATNPATGVLEMLDGTISHAGVGPRFRSQAARVGGGMFYYPIYRYPSDGPPTYAYLVFSTDSVAAPDTLHVPPYEGIERNRAAYYLISETGGRMVHGLSAAPFEPIPSWDVSASGTIVGGNGRDYVLYETNADGDTVRTIALEENPRPVSEAAAADSVSALRNRLDSLPVPTSEVAHASSTALSGESPEVHPAFIGVEVGADGAIWVELSHEIAGSRVFDVLSGSGERIRTVELRVPFSREHRIELRENRAVGVVVDEATGVQTIVRAVVR
ncbi:MAG: 6-bladed beta-propeller [Dehalococcoidia bacterium]